MIKEYRGIKYELSTEKIKLFSGGYTTISKSEIILDDRDNTILTSSGELVNVEDFTKEVIDRFVDENN